ncbi:MAG: hypothetical protein IJ295_01075, partial [Clostridia bacterium]|nr:hypothetical protein [Clostridia bacterium]
ANKEVGLKNKKLASHTRAIEKLMTATKRNMFEISARLLVIRNENLFEEDGFKDVFDYAERLFGYKKNMVYKLTTAAEKFIEHSPQGKGYVSILTHENEDYTVSQLIELNAIEPDTAVKLDELEVISPQMTTKEIREVVKAYKKGEIDENGNFKAVEETEEESEPEPEETVDETAMLIIQTADNISKILEDERIIKDTMTVSKLQEIRNFLNGINL